jgi:hypothetical protein
LNNCILPGYFARGRNPKSVSFVLEVIFDAFMTEWVFRLGQNDRADNLMVSNLRSQKRLPSREDQSN